MVIFASFFVMTFGVSFMYFFTLQKLLPLLLFMLLLDLVDLVHLALTCICQLTILCQCGLYLFVGSQCYTNVDSKLEALFIKFSNSLQVSVQLYHFQLCKCKFEFSKSLPISCYI